jgi:hypothetical protein
MEEGDFRPAGGVVAPQPSTSRGVAAVMDVSKDGQYLMYTNGSNVIVRSIAVSGMPRVVVAAACSLPPRPSPPLYVCGAAGFA